MPRTENTERTTMDTTNLTHVDSKPAPSWRLGRCTTCRGGRLAFTWKGSAPRPACPSCGGELTTTTHMLKAGFYVLEGDLLDGAERLAGGLPAAIKWELLRKDDLLERRRGFLRRLEAGELTTWETNPEYLKASGSSSLYHRDHAERLEREAKRHADKATKYARRLHKLGGAIEVAA